MSLDKVFLTKLKRFAQAFKEARDREANESDTVMYRWLWWPDRAGRVIEL